MHIEYLYYFKDFSRTLSISKTAAHYFMTPQGLSRALHQLEKDFGVTLMTYQNNLISLTPAGEPCSGTCGRRHPLYQENGSREEPASALPRYLRVGVAAARPCQRLERRLARGLARRARAASLPYGQARKKFCKRPRLPRS